MNPWEMIELGYGQLALYAARMLEPALAAFFPSPFSLGWSILVVAIIFSYLLASIPFGLLLTRLAGAGDLRAIGSGNIGATNVLRTGRKFLAAATLALDVGKGYVAAALPISLALMTGMIFIGSFGIMLTLLIAYVAPFFAVLGHMFPVWLKFKGGKGVATSLGVLFALYPPLGLFTAGIWLGVFGLIRISSLSSLIAAVAASLFAFWYTHAGYGILVSIIAALVIFRHHSNIKRLINGTEPRFGRS